MKQARRRLLGLFLAAAMMVTIIAPAGAATAGGSILQGSAASLPDAEWQTEASFPDWAGYTDDTLAMNSLISFTNFRDQGELYVSVASGVASFRMFVNNAEVSTPSMQAGKTYRLDISKVAVDGTNTVQVTNILPAGLSNAVTVYAPYPTVIDGDPADVGMDESTIQLIGDIVESSIKYGFSGAQLAVVKDGKLVVNEAWGLENGYHENGTRITEGDPDYHPVTTDTLYDLASNTKMYSVNYALQYLVSRGQISLDSKITDFFPSFASDSLYYSYNYSGYTGAPDAETNRAWKEELTLRTILHHQAGFPADPQYHNNKFNQQTQTASSSVENILWSQNRSTTLEMILKTPLIYEPGTKTLYSDVDYMLLCYIIEKVTGQRLDEFLEEHIYGPLGLTHITYNPIENGYAKEDTAATELQGNTRGEIAHGPKISFENIRTNTVWGEVHDEKAYYAMGGISGHAGLFSNAEDLAKLASVMLSGGYGDVSLFSKNTIDEFIKPRGSSLTDSQWGLGWWREGNNSRISYFSTESSSSTVGHQGWTGTMTVIDPDTNLVVVLLTNKKNSPVIDNTADPNDFVGDNMVLGALGAVVGYVYESFMSTPEAMDASIFQLARERSNLLPAHKNSYDSFVHMSDSVALADAVVTRAEQRNNTSMTGYAQQLMSDLSIIYNDHVIKTPDRTAAMAWLDELKARVNDLTDSVQPELTEKLPASPVSTLPAGAGSQVALSYPSQVNQTSTSYVYSNSTFMFYGYKGQGDIYVQVKKANLGDLKIFINGKEVDTAGMFNESGDSIVGYYKVDASDAMVNGRNILQVTNMSLIYTARAAGVTVSIPNPTVIDGTTQEVGIDDKVLDMIDAIAQSDVDNGFTSAQLAVVKDGKLVYSSAWGTVNAYNPDGTPKTDSPAVTKDTLYDLASNTKMYATNYAVQYLVQKGTLKLTDPITKYLPTFASATIEIHYNVSQGTGAPDLDTAKAWKSELTIQDILQHQAGFAPDPQFHNDKFNQVTQKPDQNTENVLYAIGKAAVREAICKAPLVYEPGTKTVYSDVDYMLLGLIVEQVTSKDMDAYLKEIFYTPLGLTHITYNPLDNDFESDQIAATELNGNSRDGVIDFTGIREGTIQGTVHDEKAYYAMGGVSGHAGLFSNAEDLAKLCQVMLNNGGYGPNKFWDINTNDYFTARKDALPTWGQGWWRQGDMGRPWYFGVQASRNTIGHQGWTGTLTMIDPTEDLVVVYLTNKINSPVTDNTVNANQFDGNWYTSSTLGFVANILYQGLESRSAASDIQPALDALMGDMAIEKMRLVAARGEIDADHPIMKATYALDDLVFDVAEARPTTQNIQNAKAVVASLDVSRDAKMLTNLNTRMDVLSPSAPSGGDSSNTTTTTKKNDDGSTTVTVTNKTTGTVTETTTWPDGSKKVIETKKDGTVTTTALTKDGVKSVTVTTSEGKTTSTVTLPGSGSATVTIPVKNAGPGTVVYLVKDDGTKELVPGTKFAEDSVSVRLSGSAKLEVAENGKTFADVPGGHWAQDAVQFVTARALFQGTGADAFSPSTPMSRAMLVTVLHRLAGVPTAEGVSFPDVEQDSWYTKAVAWANKEGIVLGTGEGFSPDVSITRESLAAILYRYAQKQGLDMSAEGTAVADFTDSSAISPWAAEAMGWAVANGILTGKTGNLLDPAGTASRAEVAMMLMRFVQNTVK